MLVKEPRSEQTWGNATGILHYLGRRRWEPDARASADSNTLTLRHSGRQGLETQIGQLLLDADKSGREPGRMVSLVQNLLPSPRIKSVLNGPIDEL